MSNITLALDFGTSNTLAAAATPLGVTPPIPLDYLSTNPCQLKSILYTPKKHQWIYGQEAINLYSEHEGEGRFFRSFKSLLPAKSFTSTSIHSERTSVEQLISRFLREVKNRASSFYQKDIENIVIGRPVSFSKDNDEDKLAELRLKKALKLSGFKNIELCYEPLAATYHFSQQLEREKLVLMIDMGGGTSDFSLLKLKRNSFDKKNILALNGVNLGGDKYNYLMVEKFLINQFGADIKYSKKGDRHTKYFPKQAKSKLCSNSFISFLKDGDLREFIEEGYEYIDNNEDLLKINNLENLIDFHQAPMFLDRVEESKKNISTNSHDQFQFSKSQISILKEISLSKFMEVSSELSETILSEIDKTLQSAQVSTQQVDMVVLTGGTTKLPSIRSGILKRFSEKQIMSTDSFQSVVSGLAHQAKNLMH